MGTDDCVQTKSILCIILARLIVHTFNLSSTFHLNVCKALPHQSISIRPSQYFIGKLLENDVVSLLVCSFHSIDRRRGCTQSAHVPTKDRRGSHEDSTWSCSQEGPPSLLIEVVLCRSFKHILAFVLGESCFPPNSLFRSIISDLCPPSHWKEEMTLRNYAQRLTECCLCMQITVVYKVYWGDPKEKISSAVVDAPLDSLVMGCRGLSALKRYICRELRMVVFQSSCSKFEFDSQFLLFWVAIALLDASFVCLFIQLWCHVKKGLFSSYLLYWNASFVNTVQMKFVLVRFLILVLEASKHTLISITSFMAGPSWGV